MNYNIYVKSLVFVTGNQYKFEIAKKALEPAGIEVSQEKLNTPEIQSMDVTEVAAYSAKWASKKLEKPVVVTDTGYYLDALNGFPGPFVKYVNKWLTAEDLLKLMEGKTNRKAEVRISMAYCEPNKDPVIFSTVSYGTIATKAGDKISNEFPIDQIFIPEGYNKVISEIPREKMAKYWVNKENYWKKLAEYFKENSLKNK